MKGSSNMAYDTAAQGQARAISEERPSTDLESFLDQVRGSAKNAQEITNMLADTAIKLRGHLPPTPDDNAKVQHISPPSGILGELRDAQSALNRSHNDTFELLSLIRSAI
jgi:hypothetical protein